MSSFKSLLKEKIEREKYVDYSSLVSLAQEEGYKISSLDRRMREICELGKIESLERKSKRGSKYIYAYRLRGSYLPPKLSDQEQQATQGMNPEYKKHMEEVMRTTINGITVPVFAAKEKENTPFPVKKEQNKLF